MDAEMKLALAVQAKAEIVVRLDAAWIVLKSAAIVAERLL